MPQNRSKSILYALCVAKTRNSLCQIPFSMSTLFCLYLVNPTILTTWMSAIDTAFFFIGDKRTATFALFTIRNIDLNCAKLPRTHCQTYVCFFLACLDNQKCHQSDETLTYVTSVSPKYHVGHRFSTVESMDCDI